MSKRINRDEIDRFHDYGIYIPTRTVRIDSVSYEESQETGTDFQMASRAISNLHILESLNEEPITILMNNLGGNYYDGIAIYDTIKNCKSHTTIIVRGQAMSMGSVILQAADERIMAPESIQMVHYGEDGFFGHAKNSPRWSKEGERVNSRMEQIYLEKIQQKHPQYTLEEVKKLLTFDTILTARQSIALGLADKIEGEE